MNRRGVLSLLARNAGYRRLWLAQFISFIGDWFTFVALVRLVKEETGGRLAVGALIAAQLAPSFFLSSIAGSTADRIPRRTVMIACDLLRAAGALGFLAIGGLGLHGAPFVATILGLVAFQHAITAFFRPAGSASIPHLVDAEDLSSAGTLDGLSWSLGLIVGSALGGLSVDHLGVKECFVLDALSFLGSAALIRTLPLPRTPAAHTTGRAGGLGDLRELFAEMKHLPELRLVILAKCAWGVGAGQLFLLTEFGDRVLGTVSASTGFGLLYAARGFGTALGPAIARRILGESNRALEVAIAFGFAGAALFYAGFAAQPPVWLALLCVAGAHGGGSMIWISGTVLVQRTAPDRVRGRAFALEMALHTVTACASPLAAAAMVDAGQDPAHVVGVFAGLTALFGGMWTFAAWRVRRAPPVTPS